MSDITERSTDFVKSVGEAARRNPVSAALLGMGVLWLFAGGGATAKAGDLLRSAGADRLPGAAKDALSNFGRSPSDTAETSNSSERPDFDAASFRSAIPDPGAVFDTISDNLSEMFRKQPLALGAIGIAIGAGIAAALPNSDVEDAYFGEASETVRKKTSEFANQQADNATTLGKDVLRAATAEANNQGLTVDGATAAVKEVTAKVGRVVDTAKKSVVGKPVV